MQGDRGLNKGDFASMTDALGSDARQSRNLSHIKDLKSGRIRGARRDSKEDRGTILTDALTQ